MSANSPKKKLTSGAESLLANIARITNPLLTKLRLGLTYEDNKWAFGRITSKPNRIRHTYEGPVANWDLSHAKPLPFGENMHRKLLESLNASKRVKTSGSAETNRSRYISSKADIAVMFEALDKAQAPYCVLRWFDELPDWQASQPLVLLVADETMQVLEPMLETKKHPGAIECEVYSASGIEGSNLWGLPYYERRLAGEILGNTVRLHGSICVPDPKRHFFSLAYHAVYHKAEKSGLPFDANSPASVIDSEVDYRAKLNELASELELDVSITLSGLHRFLSENEWSPTTDSLRKLASRRLVLKAFLQEKADAYQIDQELSVFIIRQWAKERGILPWITANLRHFGFDVKIVHELTPEEKRSAASSIRGGNWNRGPYPVNGGEPYAIVAACDYSPEPPDEQLLEGQPFARNARSINMKMMLRKGINHAVPKSFRTNVIHGADDEVEAWEYLQAACPTLVETVKNRVDRGYCGDPFLKLRLHRGKRAISYLVYRDGKPCVLKLFSDHPDARKAYNAEKRAREVFHEKSWAPLWVDSGSNWILERFYPQACRLDRVVGGLDDEARVQLAVKSLSVLSDIHQAGFAHRDIHAENFFCVDGQLILIDFETLTEQSVEVPFEQSYDITGKGLPSPFMTGSMGYSNSRSKRSLSNIFAVPFDKAFEKYNTKDPKY